MHGAVQFWLIGWKHLLGFREQIKFINDDLGVCEENPLD